MGFFGSIGKFVGNIFNEAVETVEDVIHGDAQIIKEAEKLGKVVAPIAGGVAALFPATAPFAVPAMLAGTGLQAYSGKALKDVVGTGMTTAGTYALGSGLGKIIGLGGQQMTFADFTPSGIAKMLNSGSSTVSTVGKATSTLQDIISPVFSLAETGVKTLGSLFQAQAQIPYYTPSPQSQGISPSLSDYLALTQPTYGQLASQTYPSFFPVSQLPREDKKGQEKELFMYIGIGILIFGMIAVVMK